MSHHHHGHHGHYNNQKVVIVVEKEGKHHHGHHGHHHHHHKPQVIQVNTYGGNQGFNQGFVSQGFSQGFIPQLVNNILPNTAPLFNPNQDYVITSCLDHKLALDVSQSNQNKGQLIIWKHHGKKNQRFRFVPNNHGGYCLVSQATQTLVSSNNNSGKDGQRLYVHANENGQSQTWYVIVAKDQNKFYLKNAFDKYLDVMEGKGKNGQPVIQWTFNGDKNQTWIIEPA